MKANTPEKIYIVNDDLNIKREWYKTKQVGFDTIEYIRTDAFIEKAAEYLSYHLDTNKIDVMYKFDFIEEFRNAMKI